jgi:hypothetical protein
MPAGRAPGGVKLGLTCQTCGRGSLPVKSAIAIALVCTGVSGAAPMVAQQTGVSHPPDAIVENLPAAETPQAPMAKPSAAIRYDAPPVAAPYAEPTRPAVVLRPRIEAAADPDAGIVTDVPRRPNELPKGTAMRMRLREEIATDATPSGTPFAADLSENVMSAGRVVLPAGSTVEGTITQIRGGKRFHGAALIHLQPQMIVLPDGTRMPLRAAVIDTDQYAHTKVDDEGNILRKDHVGATLAAMSITTGGAAAAGAVLGGGVGALVGAGIGAGVSTAWWLKQDRQTHLPKESLVVLELTEPLVIRALVREPEFSAMPSTRESVQQTPMAAVPAYVAPQSFVPTN